MFSNRVNIEATGQGPEPYNAFLKLSRPKLKLGKFDSQKQAIKTFRQPFVLFVMSICSFGCFPF